MYNYKNKRMLNRIKLNYKEINIIYLYFNYYHEITNKCAYKRKLLKDALHACPCVCV